MTHRAANHALNSCWRVGKVPAECPPPIAIAAVFNSTMPWRSPLHIEHEIRARLMFPPRSLPLYAMTKSVFFRLPPS